MRKLVTAFLFVGTIASVQAQTISGYRASTVRVFDAAITSAGTVVIVPPGNIAGGWIPIGDKHFFSIGSILTHPGATSFAAIGFGATDTVNIRYEYHIVADGKPSPKADTLGYYKKGETEREIALQITVIDTTLNARWLQDFTIDPTLLPSSSIRFYRQTIGGFTGGGLHMLNDFYRQP